MHEPIAYFEHGADMRIVGRGETMEQGFEHAAAASWTCNRTREHPWTSAG